MYNKLFTSSGLLLKSIQGQTREAAFNPFPKFSWVLWTLICDRHCLTGLEPKSSAPDVDVRRMGAECDISTRSVQHPRRWKKHHVKYNARPPTRDGTSTIPSRHQTYIVVQGQDSHNAHTGLAGVTNAGAGLSRETFLRHTGLCSICRACALLCGSPFLEVID